MAAQVQVGDDLALHGFRVAVIHVDVSGLIIRAQVHILHMRNDRVSRAC